MKFDIFQTKSQAIVNPVNCVGVMGAGLAKKFKEEFPENFRVYQRACTEGTVRIGKGCVTKNALPNGRKVFIFNLPTKDHWRDPSTLEYISKGLDWMVQAVNQLEIKSIAIPRIGCGLGGLNWEDVLPMIKEKVKSMRGVEVVVDGEKLGEETSPALVNEDNKESKEEGKMKKIRIFTVSMRNGEKAKKYGRVLDITKKSGIQRFTPSWEIIMGLKKKEITWEQYKEEYYRMMRDSYRKDPKGWMDTAKDGETIFLMCFCPYPQECHRSLLAGYLEKMYEKKGFLVINGGEWKP